MMINNKQELIAHLAQGHSVKYLHFWGHTPKSDGVDKSCLSQWFPASFTLDCHHYLTAEHYMMAQKALLFNDVAMFEAVLSCEHPAEAKKFGRKVKNFEADMWDESCFEFVVQGNAAKFAQNPELKAFLLDIRERVIVEASPHDPVWGIGMAVNDPDVSKPTIMNEKQQKQIGKFISLILRHEPEKIGLQLDDAGWADVSELLAGLKRKNRDISFDQLQELVANKDKKRYSFNEDLTRIRANQGHSLKLDLQLEASEPPEQLYHGTATRFLDKPPHKY